MNIMVDDYKSGVIIFGKSFFNFPYYLQQKTLLGKEGFIMTLFF
jgi:hypothetical protein